MEDLQFEDDFFENMRQVEQEAGIEEKIKKAEEAKETKPIVVAKKKKNTTGSNTVQKPSIVKPNTENRELDNNYFILEGTVDSVYITENRVVGYIKLVIKKKSNDGRVLLNFPQVTVFPSNTKCWKELESIKKDDYISVKGKMIPSIKPRKNSDEQYITTSFVVNSIRRKEKPEERIDPFFEKFGIETNSYFSRKTNTVVLSGVINKIRIKNPHCMIIRMECAMEKGLVPIQFAYYSDDFSNTVRYLYEGSYIGIVGEIRTSKRKGKNEIESLYFQDICALEIGSILDTPK